MSSQEQQIPRSWNLASKMYTQMVLLKAMWKFVITLWRGPRGQFIPNLGQKNVFFCLILQELLREFSMTWVFTLFDIPRDVVFPEILVLRNIFGFPAVNWVPEWTKTVNFGCKNQTSKDFSNTVFVLLEDHLWSKFKHDRTIFGEVRPKTPKKGPFDGSWINMTN